MTRRELEQLRTRLEPLAVDAMPLALAQAPPRDSRFGRAGQRDAASSDARATDCFRKKSMIPSGSMTDPEFCFPLCPSMTRSSPCRASLLVRRAKPRAVR
jgi:hypothetical protein